MLNNSTAQPQNYPPRHKSRGKRVSPEQLTLFAPQYEAVPYWDLKQVPTDESLSGQRYRLVLVHGNLRRVIPIQLHPNEADDIFDMLRGLDYDWSLDLDKTGQIISYESREALNCLLRAAVGGFGNA
jgi:hypothetical protein